MDAFGAISFEEKECNIAVVDEQMYLLAWKSFSLNNIESSIKYARNYFLYYDVKKIFLSVLSGNFDTALAFSNLIPRGVYLSYIEEVREIVNQYSEEPMPKQAQIPYAIAVCGLQGISESKICLCGCKELVEALTTVRNWLKFAANSHGGIVNQTIDRSLQSFKENKNSFQ